MYKKEYKKIINSQKIADEIKRHYEHGNGTSEVLKNFVENRSDLCNELHSNLNDEKRQENIINIIENIDSEKNVDRLYKAVDKLSKIKRRLNIIKVTASVAAAILTISFLVWSVVDKNTSYNLVVEDTKMEILFNPTLKISTGKIYELVSSVKSVSDTMSDYIINANSRVDVNAIHDKIADKGENVMLELSVPDRSTYTVILSEGSEVKINANSRLSYPKYFEGDKREVMIEGEAFFTVTKSDKPFIVKAKDGYIKVYGTRFNVNTREKDIVKTILVDGVVGVGAKEVKEQIIKPNQMAILNSTLGECRVTNVDADDALSWLIGSINCLNGNLYQLIEEINAWYGVDIRFDVTKVDNIQVNVMIKHTMQLDKVLKLIEQITDVKFINEGEYYIIEKNRV